MEVDGLIMMTEAGAAEAGAEVAPGAGAPESGRLRRSWLTSTTKPRPM
jgi:hypothetical protein